ncbi:MAG: two-component regulator propeller domain-containing protein [Nitrospiria bacterium]
MRSTYVLFLTVLSLSFFLGCKSDSVTRNASSGFQNTPSPAPFGDLPSHSQDLDKGEAANYILVGSFGTGETSYVRSLFADDNAVLVGTTEGVLKISTQTGEAVQTVTLRDGLLSPYIFAINKDSNNVYWFGTNNGGLSRYDGSALKNYLPADGLADFWVYGTDFAKDGTLWIATWNGVSHFDGKVFKNYNTADGLADRWVYALSVDFDEAVWFGTEGGVSRLSPNGRWKTWTHRDGLGAPNKHALPKSENTGFGTLSKSEAEDYKHNHNLSVLGPNGKETYNENYVFSMAIDTKGMKWFGTWGGGVSRFDGTTWKNFTTDDGLAGNIVYDVTIDPHDGAIWFGTNHGVSRYDGQNWTNLTRQNGLTDENVYAIAIDQKQRVWLGEKGGVDVFTTLASLDRQKRQNLRHGTGRLK